MHYTIDQELGLTRFSKDENLFSPFGLEAPSENHQRMTETSSADVLSNQIIRLSINFQCPSLLSVSRPQARILIPIAAIFFGLVFHYLAKGIGNFIWIHTSGEQSQSDRFFNFQHG